MSTPQRGMGRGLLLFLIAVIFGMLALLLVSCNQPIEFYSNEKDCLVVEQKDSFHCYTTHEAYAIHEGYHIDYAKQRFNALKLEADKIASMNDSVRTKDVYKYPSHKNKADYLKRQFDKRN